MEKRVTIKDIAAASGVTPGVVSAVLNGNKAIRCSEEKKARILDVIKQMDYRPNRAAQMLGQKKSRLIGVLHYSPESPYIAHLVGELQKQLNQRDHLAIYGFWSNYEEAKSAFKSVLSYPIDGLICTHDQLLDLIPADLPTVFYFNIPGRCCVIPNYNKYIFSSLDYLMSLGHRKIGFFGWQENLLFDYFKEQIQIRGGSTCDNWCPSGQNNYSNGKVMADKLFKQSNLPTALICRNDITAFAVINSAREHGVRVPEDLSVIGFDNIEASQYFYPALTSFGAPVEKIASSLLDTLFAGAKPGCQLIDLELHKRNTCSNIGSF